MAIGQPLDAHRAEHAGQGPAVPGLDAAVGDAFDVEHLNSLLSMGAQVEVVLEKSAQQLPASAVQVVLQFAVRQRVGLACLQPADDVFEAHPGHAERRGVWGSGPVTGARRGDRSGPGGGHRRRSARRARSVATPASALASSSARAAL